MADAFDPYADWLGIEQPQRPLSNYHLLGLDLFESRAEVIEGGVQQQTAKLAPFLKGEHARLAKRLAFEIESAKNCLLNPAIKSVYDAGLRSRESPSSAARTTASPTPSKRASSAPVHPG